MGRFFMVGVFLLEEGKERSSHLHGGRPSSSSVLQGMCKIRLGLFRKKPHTSRRTYSKWHYRKNGISLWHEAFWMVIKPCLIADKMSYELRACRSGDSGAELSSFDERELSFVQKTRTSFSSTSNLTRFSQRVVLEGAVMWYLMDSNT